VLECWRSKPWKNKDVRGLNTQARGIFLASRQKKPLIQLKGEMRHEHFLLGGKYERSRGLEGKSRKKRTTKDERHVGRSGQTKKAEAKLSAKKSEVGEKRGAGRS